LEGVTLVDPTRGLRLLRVYASGPRRRYDSASTDPGKGLPGPGSLFTDLHPVRGYSVAPLLTAAGRRGVNLLLGLSARRRGGAGSRAIRVDSRQGPRRFRDTFPYAYVACVGPPRRESDLPPCPGAPPGIGRVNGG